MTALTTKDLSGTDSPHYWLGYLHGSLMGVLAGERDSGEFDRRHVVRALTEYEASPVHRPRDIVAVAVIDRQGECYAIRESVAEAEAARADAVQYLSEAAACGHPRAPGWVAERMPFATVCLDADERDEMLDNGTPVLDREP